MVTSSGRQVGDTGDDPTAATLPESVDVVIVGGGPAGLTLASILKKYRPETSVLVLEKEHFPRHKIGEGLIVDINRVLFDMGALPAVDAAGFSKKYGVTFVWGEDREPQTFIWMNGPPPDPSPEYQLEYTFHVDRPVYDQILADCATKHGAIVAHGFEVRGVLWEGDRACGVRARTDDGERSVRARYVVDCAGGHGPLTKEVAGRAADAALRNIAVYGYYRGVDVDDALMAAQGKRRTLVITAPQGWFWVIPLMNGVTSVGFVTSVDHYLTSVERDPAAYHAAMLRSLPEYERLFARAELLDHRGDGRMIHTVREYSYSCDTLWGPGWVVAGDASGFVDAVLSIGCFVAQNHAQFLGYALASVLDGQSDEAVAFDSYATTVQENLRAFRAVAHMFYAFNPNIATWWRECAERLGASSLVPDDADREAFVTFSTGFAARNTSLYEDAIHAFGRTFVVELSERLFGPSRPFDRRRIDRHFEAAERLVAGDPALRFVAPYTTRPFALPHTGTGRLRALTRLEIQLPEPHGRMGAAVVKRVYLPDTHRRALDLFDGRHTLSAMASTLAAEGAGTVASCRQEVAGLAFRLACVGALARADAPRAEPP